MQKYIKQIYFTLLLFLLMGFMSLDSLDPMALLKNTPQNLFLYTPAATLDKPMMSPEMQQKFYQTYLNTYFSPWNHDSLLYTPELVRRVITSVSEKFKAHPGWGENWQPHTINWINALIKNMQFSTYPNINQFAITTHVTHLRVFPTDKPIFKDWDQQAGNGYPFDALAISTLPFNLPIKIVQLSSDHAWAFVLTPYNAVGWIPVTDYAQIDKAFIQRWQTGHYAVGLKDKVSVLDDKQQFLLFTRLGFIYPILKEEKNAYRILTAVANEQHQAVIQTALLPKNAATLLPLPLTTRNIATIGNYMLGQPYNWSGNYEGRDCSATLMDLFAVFGIWLPRNSVDQAHHGTFISLASFDSLAQKKAFVEKHAIPLATILWAPGHVALYVGKRGDQQYIYQQMWGLRTWSWLKGEGRLVIGKAVITPMDFGEGLAVNLPSFFARTQGMTLLITPSESSSKLTLGGVNN